MGARRVPGFEAPSPGPSPENGGGGGRAEIEVPNVAKQLLWIDCLGGLLVGALVLSFHQWLSKVENLPVAVVLFMGIANLAYGAFSLYVTTRTPRPIGLVGLLATANRLWLLVCLAIAAVWFEQISAIGIGLVLAEGLYVATLGQAEWRLRRELAAEP